MPQSEGFGYHTVNGRPYFSDPEIIGHGYNYREVKSFTQTSNDTWVVKITYEFSPDNEDEITIVLENGIYKIDKYSVDYQ